MKNIGFVSEAGVTAKSQRNQKEPRTSHENMEPDSSDRLCEGFATNRVARRGRIYSNTPYYVKALALGIPAILLGFQLAGWIGFLQVIADGHPDFRQLYTAGYMVRTGHARHLYDYNAQKSFQDALISREQIALPFNHLAYEGLLLAPFSLLPFRMAYLAFVGFNITLLWTSFCLARSRLAGLAEVWQWLPLAMFVCFLPIAAALMQGQDSIVLLTLFTAALVSLDQGRELRAGALVALGLIKFQICLPIVLLFLAWRRWRFCIGFALSGALVGAASLWM